MDDEIQMVEQGDSLADAIAAIALIMIFVTTCIFWINGQQICPKTKFTRKLKNAARLRFFMP